MKRDLYRTYKKELAEIKERSADRRLSDILVGDGKFIVRGDTRLLNLSSNDYLGFASDRKMHDRFFRNCGPGDIIDSLGLGASSSRLLAGNHSKYAALEHALSELYSKHSFSFSDGNAPKNKQALVFTSGYHANTGILPALAGAGDLICSDALNHASIIDGIRLSRAERIVYGHLDYEGLAASLAERRGSFRNVIIVSESIFSMDGDIADLKRLAEIKNDFDALLYVDEAHAVGVFGEDGLGICARDRAIAEADVIVATFGKALGSLGAYTVTDPVIAEYLVNKARSLIFTTALPPVIAHWSLFALREMRTSTAKRGRLIKLSDKLRAGLARAGCATGGQSHIVPVIFGENRKAVEAADALLKRSFFVFPIRPPSVPEGCARIRISLRADMEWEDVKEIPEILRPFT
jgi:8-amino-7-oxononanoate synthase